MKTRNELDLIISLWKSISVILRLYFIFGILLTVFKMYYLGYDLFLSKVFCLYFFSVGAAAFLNFFLPIPGHQRKRVIFIGALSGFTIMIYSSLIFSIS